MWNVETQFRRFRGGRLTARRAGGGLDWEAERAAQALAPREKRMPDCNGRDTGCNIPGSVRRLTFHAGLWSRER